MIKQKFYNNKKILEKDANYNILLGERSNGKSYCIKEYCVRNAFQGKGKFIYLRRYRDDVKESLVNGYFTDCPVRAITSGKYTDITCYRSAIYLCNYDDSGKCIKGELIGKVMYLSGSERFKSQAYPDYTDIIFEEFVTKKLYLDNEPDLLQDLVSTVARRRKIRVWLIGNTINRINPYFAKWSLSKIPNQKQGTIDMYYFHTNQIDDFGNELIIKIAVEFCENSGNNSKMFFGAKEKSIAGGQWETETYPTFPKDLECERLYTVGLSYDNFFFAINLMCELDTGLLFLFVYPKNIKDNRIERVLQQGFSCNANVSNRLKLDINAENLIAKCLRDNKICYSDNLTAEDFNQCLKQIGGVI